MDPKEVQDDPDSAAPHTHQSSPMHTPTETRVVVGGGGGWWGRSRGALRSVANQGECQPCLVLATSVSLLATYKSFRPDVFMVVPYDTRLLSCLQLQDYRQSSNTYQYWQLAPAGIRAANLMTVTSTSDVQHRQPAMMALYHHSRISHRSPAQLISTLWRDRAACQLSTLQQGSGISHRRSFPASTTSRAPGYQAFCAVEVTPLLAGRECTALLDPTARTTAFWRHVAAHTSSGGQCKETLLSDKSLLVWREREPKASWTPQLSWQ
ncbi:TPA: hypothetical protein ACH3X3_014939 [Trebouxia sp. C0006]